jgi:hypothetical protein
MGMGVGRESTTRCNPRRRIGVSEGNLISLMGYATSNSLNPHLRRLPLYPTELRARPVDFTAHSLPSQRIGDSLCGESSGAGHFCPRPELPLGIPFASGWGGAMKLAFGLSSDDTGSR